MKFLFLFFILLSCKDIDDKKSKEDRKKTSDFIFLYSIRNRNEGNCLRVETTSTGKTITCDRRPSSICNSNIAILNSGEKLNLLNEARNFTSQNPECTTSFAIPVLGSGLSTDKVPINFEEEDRIKQNNYFEVVSSCESLGFQLSTPISTLSEFEFLTSAKGRIGIAADRISSTSNFVLQQSLGSNFTTIKNEANTCLNKPFSREEVELIQSIRSGTKLLQASCNFVTTTCPSSLEKYR